MTAARDNLRAVLREALRYVAGHPDIVYHFTETKTENYYRRAIGGATLDLYRGKMDGEAFVDKLAGLIEDQFRRAWNEGARDSGFTGEMTDDDLLPLIDRMAQEQDYIYKLADDIEAARTAGSGTSQFGSRLDMWSGRYSEIRDWARTHFGKKKRFKWTLGEAEHCNSCLTLSGTVATGQQWEEARGRGIYPMSHDLECHGYNCACSLQPTDDPVTGAIPEIS